MCAFFHTEKALVLRTDRRQYLIERSQAMDFNGDNHVFILHHEPYMPVTPNRLYKIFNSFLEKECADLPHYRLHDLRHTYFFWYSNIGFNEQSIIATGGHSSIRSTRPIPTCHYGRDAVRYGETGECI